MTNIDHQDYIESNKVDPWDYMTLEDRLEYEKWLDDFHYYTLREEEKLK